MPEEVPSAMAGLGHRAGSRRVSRMLGSEPQGSPSAPTTPRRWQAPLLHRALPLVAFAIFAILPTGPGVLALLDERLHGAPEVIAHVAGEDQILPVFPVRGPDGPG